MMISRMSIWSEATLQNTSMNLSASIPKLYLVWSCHSYIAVIAMSAFDGAIARDGVKVLEAVTV